MCFLSIFNFFKLSIIFCFISGGFLFLKLTSMYKEVLFLGATKLEKFD